MTTSARLGAAAAADQDLDLESPPADSAPPFLQISPENPSTYPLAFTSLI